MKKIFMCAAVAALLVGCSTSRNRGVGGADMYSVPGGTAGGWGTGNSGAAGPMGGGTGAVEETPSSGIGSGR